MSIISFDHKPVPNLPHYILGSGIGLLLFLGLLLSVLFLPVVSNWDLAVSTAIQQFRTPELDRIMVGITMLADTRVGTIIVSLIVVGLCIMRRWWLGVHLASVAISASLTVSICKSLMARARPELIDGLLISFSFPSGHSCTAALVSGLLALLFAYRREALSRYVIYGVAALIAITIAFSRVYLLAHWPSDVMAGLSLGFALIVTFAWQLHVGMTMQIPFMKRLLMGSAVIVFAAYLIMNFSDQAPRYGLVMQAAS